MEARHLAFVLLYAGSLLSIPTSGKQWTGYPDSLWDAQVECQNLRSPNCKPYIAEALGVAAALEDAAKLNSDLNTYTVVFHNGTPEICTERWRVEFPGFCGHPNTAF